MDTAPLISVLMPVYNAQRYLAKAVASILSQTLGAFEFIIINDGSTDSSLAILKTYAARDPRIRLVSRPNTGYVKALNEALALARGEFVARMDADDVAMPERFERQIQYLRANPEVVLLGGASELIDGAGRLLLRPSVLVTDEQLQAAFLEGRTEIGHPTAMIRRKAMVDAGGYDESLRPSEDLDLWLRLAEIGKVANLPDFIIQYRIHDKSVSSANIDLQIRKAYEATERAWKRRGIVGLQFDLTRRTRPTNDRKSRCEFTLQYGWWAFNSGERYGAIQYGMRAIGLMPCCLGGWRLLMCSIVKPMAPITRTQVS
jgi:glycosyltransferase involved in cell wall biosynthesis